MMTMHARYQGYVRLQVYDSLTDSIRVDTGWFPNLITNQGLDWIGAGAPIFNTGGGVPLCTHAAVGTGNTAPSFADTRMTSFLAMFPATTASNVEGNGSTTFVNGSPAYWSAIKSYSFAQGAVVGNVAEVGFGNTAQTDTNPQLFSHALVVDGSGNPTTISVTATDALTLTYELRMYLDLTDNSYSVNISATTYSGIYRRSGVGTVPFIFYQVDNRPGVAMTCDAYNGTIGTVLQVPTGTRAGYDSVSSVSYIPGTYYKSFTGNFGLGSGNLAGGITAMVFGSNHGNWQFSVSPAIPKTSAFTMTQQFNISWSRYP